MIVTFLKWALGLFETKQTKVEAWPLPSEEAIAKVEEVKKKPAVKKATTRKPAVKKPAVKKAK